MDDRSEGGQFGAEFADRVAAVVLLASVAVAVDGEQDDGFDLLEAVEDAAGAEVRGAGRPDAADGRGREEGDDGLGDVRQVAADPVARAYADGAQFGGERADLAAQFGPGHGAWFVCLVHMEDGRGVRARGVGGRAQGVFGVVQGGAGEPFGAGHGAVAEHARVRGGEPDVEPVGDGLPERVQFGHRPAVQCFVTAVGGAPWCSDAQAWKRVICASAMNSSSGFQSGVGFAADGMGRLPDVRVVCVGPAHGPVCARDAADRDDAM